MTDSWYGRMASTEPFPEVMMKNALKSGSIIPPPDGPGLSPTQMWVQAAFYMGAFIAACGLAYWWLAVTKP